MDFVRKVLLGLHVMQHEENYASPIYSLYFHLIGPPCRDWRGCSVSLCQRFACALLVNCCCRISTGPATPGLQHLIHSKKILHLQIYTASHTRVAPPGPQQVNTALVSKVSPPPTCMMDMHLVHMNIHIYKSFIDSVT